MVQIEEKPAASVGYAGSPRLPSVSPSDMRQLIPPLGLKEYWYPALEAKQVKRRPVGLKICGVDLVFFRDRAGEVQCLWNVCPHRGASLMHGDCHFAGTISCPYHGWTFDGEGNCLAVLAEGPSSQVPGRVKARKYPTRTLKGMVFVWMGDGEPAPIEEDVPPEFFDDMTMILFALEYWPVQWNVALENSGDSHVRYVHRNSFRQLQAPIGFTAAGGAQKVINGRALITARRLSEGPGARNEPSDAAESPKRGKRTYQRYFPGVDAYWPKHRWRRLWTWIWAINRKRLAKLPPWDCEEEWRAGHHLPCMYRGDHRTDIFTRNCVPVTENLSRQIYFKGTRPKNWIGRVYERVFFTVYWRWAMVTNFSRQDFKAVAPQRYDTPEHLAATDIHQIYWRRMILQARGMLQPEEVRAIPVTDAEKSSYELQGKAPEVPSL